MRAEPLEALAWELYKEMLDNPSLITQLGIDHYLYLEEFDANHAAEIQRLQRAMVEQEAAKQRVIGLVARAKIGDGDADTQLDVVNAEANRLHAELNALETNRRLAGAYLKRLKDAEATVKAVGMLPDTPANRRRTIEDLLQRIEVRTTGEGRNKQAQQTFYWLGRDPFMPIDIRDLREVRIDAALLNEIGEPYAS